MSANPRSTLLTVDDYMQMPEESPRYELLDGRLVLMAPSPNIEHQEITGSLYVVLRTHVQLHQIGRVFIAPTDVVLSRRNVVQPDVLFVARDRLHIIGSRTIQGPPDLVIEVLSPSNREHDAVHKFRIYAEHGVPHCWMVDPSARRITAYVLADSEYRVAVVAEGHATFSAPPLEGLVINLAEIWPA